MALNPSKPAFGIDLGTTNSVIGYYNNGKPDILASSKTGDRTVPSYVCYGQALPIVGQKAQKQIERYPKQVAYDAKRMIGLDYSHSAIQQNKEFWIFDVVEGENNRPVYDLGDGRKLLPEESNNLKIKVRLREMCEKVKQDLSDSTEETNAVKESSLQIGDINEVLLIGGSSRVKEIREMLEELFINQRLNESVNPDEAVAYGATIRAAQILNDKAFPHVLIEKLPIGIGTDLSEDRYDIVLERNTLIPSEEVKKNYVTTFNNQKSISFYIYEGERPIASKNTLLGKFSIKVPPKDVGEVKVILTMSIDKNGILKVYAEYEGNKEELIIDSGKISSGNKIKEMLKEMKMYEEMDRVEVLAKTARSSMRNNIEHIKAVCEKETGANIKRLMNTVKEIDGWLSSTSEPLTREIKQKFISIEDEAEKLVKKYNKNIADQNCRKALLTAAESSRQINKNKKIEDILKVLEKDKFEPKTTRVLNRTNAIAIAYLRKLVEDTRKIPFDRKIPKLDLFVYCVDINNCYSARFETKHGVVRQTKFKDYSVSESNWRSFDDGISLLKHKVFDYLPKLPSLNCLSLLGADTKSRMLCGDIDYIDYDVPPVSLHKATLTLNDIEVSLVDNCEQLPIERTILESERKINVEIKYDPPINGAEVYEKKDITEYRVIVSSSGIFVDIGRA
ncbi:hypothetical protein FO519_002735 [Halicephalobus sp. NKZ332]|nr:hypothetical protein FO519_002735 [Halicephalobus sp. NKZ332]